MDSMIWAILKMTLALGMVCTVLFFLARALRRNGMAGGNPPLDSGIRILTTQLIAPQKYISLVEIDGQVLALGITEAQITLLTKIENKEFLERIAGKGSKRHDPLSLFQYLPIRYKGLKIGLLRRLHGR
jgi:flagellar biogenesis protein FliO